jgi:Tol biopolymer transport system component
MLWNAFVTRFLLYQVQDSSNPRWTVWVLPLSGDRTPVPLLSNEFTNYAAHLSPDGNWIAYNSTESGTFDVYIQRFPSPRAKMRIARGNHPRWNQNGRELVFWSEPSA